MFARLSSVVATLLVSAVIISTDTPSPQNTPAPSLVGYSRRQRTAGNRSLSNEGLIAYTTAQTILPHRLEPGTDIRLHDSRADSRRLLLSRPGLITSELTWSPNGQLLAFTGREAGNEDVTTINVVDLAGHLTELEHEPAGCHNPTWSPDSQQLLFVCSYYDRPTGLFEVRLADGRMKRLTTDRDTESQAGAWSPSSQELVYVLEYGWGSRLILRRLNNGREQVLWQGSRHLLVPPVWAPDGRTIVVVETAYGTGSPGESRADAVSIDAATGVARELTGLPVGIPLRLQFAPDGSRVVFYSRTRDDYRVAEDVNVLAWPSLIAERTWSGSTYVLHDAAVSLASPSPAAGLRYWALGDSVAAGEGLCYDWIWQGVLTGSAPWERLDRPDRCGDPSDPVAACHRSDKAYPYLVAQTENWQLRDAACTGASADNGVLAPRVFSDGVQGEAQLTPESFAAAGPDVISLTMGADDLHFVDWLRSCYGPARGSCASDNNQQRFNDQLAEVGDHVLRVLRTIRSLGEQAGHVPAVILTTYYDPFPDQLVHCRDLSPLAATGADLTASELAWLKQGLAALNTQIRRAAAGFPNVTLVDLQDVMSGHTLCSADPWVYGPSILTAQAYAANPAPFHPTPAGQGAIASRIQATIG